MKHNRHNVTANFADGSRFEVYQGRRHLVLPIIMMVEGVHNGSGGPILYMAEELSQFPEAWTGRPVPVLHPEVNGVGVSANHPEIMEEWNVGQLFNTHWDGSKLRSEAWIDVALCQERYPELYARLSSGEPMDVSTGLFSDDELAQGTWNGESYMAIARNIRPDHLALLPGTQGACSWQDGCGVRVNQKEDSMNGKEHPPVQNMVTEDGSSGGFTSFMKSFFETITANEMSMNDKVRALQRYADSLDVPDRLYNYIDAVYDDYFVLREAPMNGDSSLYKINYTFDEDQNLSVGNEREPVRKDVSYVATNEEEELVDNEGTEEAKAEEAIVDNPETVHNEQEEESMSVNAKIKELADGLIANEATQFTEEDREFLQGMTECQLNKLTPITDNDQDEELEAQEAQTPTDNVAEDQITVSSDQLEEMIANGIKANEEAKVKGVLLKRLEDAGQDSKEFAALSVNALQKVADTLAPVATFAGRGFPTEHDLTDNEDAIPDMAPVVLADSTKTEQ